MKQQQVIGFLTGCALLSIVALGACKNDPAPTSADVQSTAASGDAANADITAEASTSLRTPESTIKTAQDLLVKHSELRDLMTGLQERILKVPVEIKQNVADYSQLEATLEGYTEKGDYRLDELYRVINQTQKEVQSADAPAKDSKEGSERLNYLEVDQILVEHARSVDEIKSEYAKLKAAVERLERAPNKGKGLRLFE